MTPRITRFLAEQAPATPCLILDVERVEENYRAIRAALPLARVYYAIKANPAPQVLRRLVSLGSCFDAASFEEIAMGLAAGATPDRISFGNTIKKSAAIRRAYEAGIRLFVFDSEQELEKIAANAPGAKVYCRLLVGNDGAVWPLSRKFGTSMELARELMIRAGELGLDPYGLSFHVGSQQTSPEAHEAAIGQAAMLMDELAEAGVKLRMLNLGGGFPARYQDDVPAIGVFAEGIMRALRFQFDAAMPEIFVEPGRFIVGDAALVSAEVVLVSRKAKQDPVRWVYLDIGRFGGLSETEGEAVKYHITTPHDGGPDGPVILAGPTCDSADTLYEKSNYHMPMALTCGDRVQIHATGAYVTTYATQNFNGFKPLDEYYLEASDDAPVQSARALESVE